MTWMKRSEAKLMLEFVNYKIEFQNNSCIISRRDEYYTGIGIDQDDAFDQAYEQYVITTHVSRNTFTYLSTQGILIKNPTSWQNITIV